MAARGRSSPIRDGFTDGGVSAWLEAMLGTAGLLPSQWADMHRAPRRAPELDLVMALIEGAMVQYFRKPKQRQEARDWFDTDFGPCSFRFCAEAIDADPERLRAGILALFSEFDAGGVTRAPQHGVWLRHMNRYGHIRRFGR